MKSMSARLRLKHLTTGLCLAIGLEAVALPAPPLRWVPVGLSGGGMFAPAISPADPNLMMLNCDMSTAYLSEDGGRTWRMIHHAQLRSDTACRPAFHPTDRNIIYASFAGRFEISRDRGMTFASIGNLKDSLGGEIAINPSAPKIILAGSRSGRCWLSRGNGKIWRGFDVLPFSNIQRVEFDSTNEAVIHMTTFGGSVRRGSASPTEP